MIGVMLMASLLVDHLFNSKISVKMISQQGFDSPAGYKEKERTR